MVWLVLIQIVASGIGGYLAGRLRTKWVAIHSDEVYFRDTAHGFLVWAESVVITAAFLGSAATTMVGRAARSEETGGPENAYFVDALFRLAPGATTGPGATASVAEHSATHGDASLVLANVLREGDTAAADRAYLAQLVSATTGLGPNDAVQRVSEVLRQARQAADVVRKATARLLLWTFLALLIGAFSASYAATIGGRQRDHMKAV